MKKFYLLLLILTSFLVQAQSTTRERRTIHILKPETFYLNGGNMATFGGGKSRMAFNFQLPPNTIEWYYTYSTAKGDDPAPSIDLFSQLTRLVDQSGFTAIATKAILTPRGAAICDTYLFDKANADKFIEKADNWGGSYLYWEKASRFNSMQATVDIKDQLTGNYSLGFKNPSAVQGITVTFEVVAIVEETKVKEKTDTETRAEMFGELGWKSYEKGEYDKCMELSKKAIDLNPDMGWVHNNIGLVQLIKKDYLSAIDSYAKAIVLFKKDANTKQWFGAAIEDLTNLIKKHGELEGARDILELLNTERQKS